MISLNNITKIYTSKSGKTSALQNVSVKFAGKGLNFILGKSGCGKSTLLNLLGGLDRPTSGEILVDGCANTNLSESELDAYRNTCVGFVFQEYNLLESHTVGFNIGLALELKGEKPDRQRSDELLRRLQLVDEDGETLYDRYVNELSGGQKQRVAIARALVKNPKIILADEPTGALDSETSSEFYRLLKEISVDRLVIVVTHDRKGAEEFGDRIIELADGKIISDTNPEVVEEISQIQAYGKSRLPFKRVLLMGFEGFKVGPVRFLISIVLSAVTLVIFGFSCSASQSNEMTTFINTMYDQNYSVVVLTKRGGFSTSEYNRIVEFNGGVKPVRGFTYMQTIRNENIWESYKAISNMRNPYIDIGYLYWVDTYAEVNPQTGEKDLNLTADARFKDKSLCRLPNDYNEIAITDLMFDVFQRFGYLSDEGEYFEIRTPDDMIGKTIGGIKVCGVYSTEIDCDFLRKYDKNNYGMTDREIALGYRYELEEPAHSYFQSVTEAIISYAFVKEGFTKNHESNVKDIGGNYIVKLSGDFNKDYTLLSALDSDDGNTLFIPQSFVTNLVSSATFWSDSVTLGYTSAATVILAVFSLLMILNSLLTSIDHRKREMGVLRAIGAGAKELSNICLAESLISSALSFILGTVGTVVLCNLANNYYFINIFSCGIIAVLLMLILSVGFTALTTLLAASNISRKKPIDILNDD